VSLTVFMISPSTLFMLAATWLTGAAIIAGLFLLNRRRLLRNERSSG
jgi:hypothetical protein